MVKKALALLLLLGLAFSAGRTAGAYAEGKASVTLSIDRTNSAVGSTLKVTLTGRSLSDVYAYQAVLRYDDKRLKLKGAAGPSDGYAIDPIVKNGEITIAHTKVGNRRGDSGTLTLATLTFAAVAPGQAQISLAETKLVDSGLNVATVAGGGRVGAAIGGSQALSDIAGHWAEAAILRAAALGIVQGGADGRFMPNRPVTRAEFAVMLARALHPEAGAGAGSGRVFRDSSAIPSWGKEDVAAAAGAGWIGGYADGRFRPAQPITRAELAAMAVRSSGGRPAGTEKLAVYADADRIAAWARPSVAIATVRKLLSGRSGGVFAPDGATTRAEAAVVLLRMIDAKTSEGG
ncbi:S-layer homology domain-containing protein [Cohnella zeiphila]|uniref:S-layer homology domain-containing protein n=1 Tax=Cohnella zeiphila TaxID=2761120 RepID=A0A7X0VZ76_9BACL|nr:S-layer homology domain-containing protein [Cohnella zeiphila]MBB6735277.1 S-layer homology domain-containing protein [Cohnella zeiphila]